MDSIEARRYVCNGAAGIDFGLQMLVYLSLASSDVILPVFACDGRRDQDVLKSMPVSDGMTVWRAVGRAFYSLISWSYGYPSVSCLNYVLSGRNSETSRLK